MTRATATSPAMAPVRGRGGLRPEPLPRWRGLRPLKRWTYLGVFGDAVMACFGEVSIGGLPQGFWAVWDGRALRERTVFRGGRVSVADAAVRVADGRARIELALEPAGEPVEVRSRHGRQLVWTRKRPVRVSGTVLGRAVDGVPGLVDESAGWHARVTRWSWSAGAGAAADGTPVWWNLVDGVHDDPRASERTVWRDGSAQEVGPVRFEGLAAVTAASGERLEFAAEAERARHDRLVLVDSAYRQPFGRFTGVLPDGTALRDGRGVMERHDVRW